MSVISSDKMRLPYGGCIPYGWFTVGVDAELQPGDVKAVKYFNKDWVLFRTESGDVNMLEAYCPHLGAHLGYGGKVVGETIQCPFHGFQFNGDGKCTRAYIEGSTPARAKVATMPVIVKNGFIMAYHGPEGVEPDWEIPELDFDGWLPIQVHEYILPTHCQEINENSVDVGHFTVVHSYTRADINRKPVADGANMQSCYTVERRVTNPENGEEIICDMQIDLDVWGIGYSLVNSNVDLFQTTGRFFVLATPIDEQTTHLRIAATQTEESLAPTSEMFGQLVDEVDQDLLMWRHKIYVPHPAVAKGDGPIGLYRRWAKQFYPTDVIAEFDALYGPQPGMVKAG